MKIHHSPYIEKINHITHILNQALWPARAWFLEIAFVQEVGMRVCVCVCVRPRAIKNYSRELKSEQPIKQVLLPFSFSVWHLLLILLMGGALLTKRVMCYFQRRAR